MYHASSRAAPSAGASIARPPIRARPPSGLEHFGFDSDHLETDIARLEGLDARQLEGPIQIPNGPRIAFLRAPDDVRVELIERRKNIAGGSDNC